MQVQQATGEAVATLRQVMQAADAPASAKVSAAKTILETAVKAVELEDLEARIVAPPAAPAAPAARLQPPVLSVPCGAGHLGHAPVGCSPGWAARGGRTDARRGPQREQRGMG